MGGLLYKDFVSVSGKKLIVGITFFTLVYSVLRIAFSGCVRNELFMATNELGQEVNILDSFFIMGQGLFVVGVIGLMNGWVSKIVGGDQKNKIKNYVYSMPIEKNTYIASKYVFIGVSAYTFFSVAMIWSTICNAFCGEGNLLEVSTLLGAFLAPCISLVLLSAAIELPMFILMGRDKAMLVKIAIIMVIAFVVIGFLFFGDLNRIGEKLNIATFVEWCNTHAFAVSFIQVVSPVVILALYYMSYCITCHFNKKEAANIE